MRTKENERDCERKSGRLSSESSLPRFGNIWRAEHIHTWRAFLSFDADHREI